MTTLLNLLSSKDKLPETREELTLFALTYSDRTGDWSFVEELEWHDDCCDHDLQENRLREWVLRIARSYPTLVRLSSWQDLCDFVYGEHTIMIEYYVCDIRIDTNKFTSTEVSQHQRDITLSKFTSDLRNALHNVTL